MLCACCCYSHNQFSGPLPDQLSSLLMLNTVVTTDTSLNETMTPQTSVLLDVTANRCGGGGVCVCGGGDS